MELTQLRYFLAVAEIEHMTRAAERLHVAQPALTQAIRRLEGDLGVTLFVPRGRGIALTDEGRALRESLDPILRELDALPERLRAMAEREEVTLHLLVQAASALVTEAVIAYRQTHPRLHFRLSQADDPDCDIAVTTRPTPREPSAPDPAAFVQTEQIFLAVPHEHPFAARGRIALGDAAGEAFISLMGSRQLRHICDRACRAAGFAPRIVFESDSPAAVQNMIAARMGVGFWPQFTWGATDPARLALVEIVDPPCRRDIVIARRDCRGGAAAEAVGEFYAFLCRYLADRAD